MTGIGKWTNMIAWLVACAIWGAFFLVEVRGLGSEVRTLNTVSHQFLFASPTGRGPTSYVTKVVPIGLPVAGLTMALCASLAALWMSFVPVDHKNRERLRLSYWALAGLYFVVQFIGSRY